MAKTVYSSLLLALPLLVLVVGGAMSMSICNMDTNQLSLCLPAIQPPVSTPTTGCCDCIRRADVKCLCNYKNLLPTFGIDPSAAMQLPKKCNITQLPVCGGNP